MLVDSWIAIRIYDAISEMLQGIVVLSDFFTSKIGLPSLRNFSW